MNKAKPALWPPPENFVAAPSLVEGIELYAPAPEEEPEEKTRSFKCQYCGGVISYSAAERQLTCPHCGRAQEIDAKQVGQAATEFEFTLKTMEHTQYGWGEEKQELVCESCGAMVAVEPDVLTSTCAFCGSNHVLARSASNDDLRPTALVPFSVDQNQCHSLVTEWLGRGWMHPSELQSIHASQEMSGIYLPFWTFDAHVQAAWKAEVGIKKRKRYYADGEWKTRTVIEWNWRSGQEHLPTNDHLVPGTAQVSQIILHKTMPFDLDGLVEYAASYLAGWQAKTYDVELQKAWDVARKEMRKRIKQACYKDTGSSHVRNMRMTTRFADEQWRYILLPVYLASYHFKDRTFQVMVNGQTGSVAGQKPVAWLRVWLVIAAILSPSACLGMLGLLTIPLGGSGGIGVVLGLILLAIGLAIALQIFRKAQASEEA